MANPMKGVMGASAWADYNPSRGFVINIALGDNKEKEQVQQRLVSAIKKSVDWSENDLSEHDAWIEVLPGRLLVRHTPKVLSQVQATLHQIKLLAPVVTGATGGGGIGNRRAGGGSGGAF